VGCSPCKHLMQCEVSREERRAEQSRVQVSGELKCGEMQGMEGQGR
jgi:hypothetical protein